jgi:hypothetical protein
MAGKKAGEKHVCVVVSKERTRVKYGDYSDCVFMNIMDEKQFNELVERRQKC